MPIVSNDIEYRLSGGAGNADPAASLGGIMSATAMPANLFDNVSGDEGAAGDTEYRCIYVRNAHATLTLEAPKLWLVANTPSADTDVAVALDGAGAGDGSTTGVAETVVDEQTAPVGEVFSAPASKATGIAMPALGPGQAHAIWVRRTVNAGAAAVNGDGFTIRVEGDTAA